MEMGGSPSDSGSDETDDEEESSEDGSHHPSRDSSSSEKDDTESDDKSNIAEESVRFCCLFLWRYKINIYQKSSYFDPKKVDHKELYIKWV